jgi:hypothetical protein
MAFWGEDFWDSGFATKFFVAVIVSVTAVMVYNDAVFERAASLKTIDGTVVAEPGMSRDDFLIRMRSFTSGKTRTDPITDISSVAYPVSFTGGLQVPWRRKLFPFNYVSVFFKDDAVSDIFFFGDVTRKGLFFPPLEDESDGQEKSP